MDFSNSLFLLPILTGPVFILVSLFLKYSPPADINGLVGYRTPRSMSSQQRWDFAQVYSGKIMLISGMVYTLTAALGFVLDTKENMGLFTSLGLMFLAIAPVFVLTEYEMKKRFGQS